MTQLGIIIQNEYKTDVRSKSFWIATIIVPVIFLAFSMFGGYMMSESDTAMGLSEALMGTPGSDEPMTGMKVLGLLTGMFLVLFLMIYGSQIFNKVKIEKTNRIVEILATSVDGRTMMLAKIISVALVGMTQLLIWGCLIGAIIFGVLTVFPIDIPWGELLSWKIVMFFIWAAAYFAGGYILFGSMFAAVGAMTDKNDENQEYVAVLTLILLMSMYIAQYAIDHGSSTFVTVCNYIPFTSPSIGCVLAISGSCSIWETLLSLAVLYLSAWITLMLSGKIYTSSLLLKGKKATPKDIITFLKSK